MARRTTRKVAARLPEESAPEHWLRTIRFSGFSLLMLGLLIEQQQQIAALQATVGEAQASVDDLTDDVARWDDPAYIESQARERLFYILPGDISYLVTGDEGIATTDEGLPISSTIQTTQVDWLRSLLSSIYTSGLTDAPPEQLEGGVQ